MGRVVTVGVIIEFISAINKKKKNQSKCDMYSGMYNYMHVQIKADSRQARLTVQVTEMPIMLKS